MKTNEHDNHEHLNYWTPLTSQAKALEKPIPSPPPPTPKVQFTLSKDHQETNGWKWRHLEVTRIRNGGRRRLENSTQRRRRRAKTPLTKEQIKAGILDGTIASAISDTSATSTAGRIDDPFGETGQTSFPDTVDINPPTNCTTSNHCMKHVNIYVRIWNEV